MIDRKEYVSAVQKVWDYNCLNHERSVPENVDVVVALGCKDVGVARCAADVQMQHAPDALLVVSGKHGQYTRNMFTLTEAEVFAEVASEKGVPREQILLETSAHNTGENVRFTHRLLREVGRTAVSSVVLVQKPFLERRALATFEAQWPGAENVHVTTISEDLDFEHYCSEKHVPPDDVVRQVIGAMNRVITYPALGFQTEQPIPVDVYRAYRRILHEEHDELSDWS